MNTVPWLLSLLLMASCSAQAARVYSWVDPQGVTHYTDAPPPGKSAKEVDLRVSPLIGIACAVAGLLVSRAWSVSAGGAITLIAAAVVGLAHLVPQRRTVPARAVAGSVVAS